MKKKSSRKIFILLIAGAFGLMNFGTVQAQGCGTTGWGWSCLSLPVFPAPDWNVSPWSPCNTTCGSGQQARVVRCANWLGFDSDPVNCTKTKPSSVQNCTENSGCTPTVPTPPTSPAPPTPTASGDVYDARVLSSADNVVLMEGFKVENNDSNPFGNCSNDVDGNPRLCIDDNSCNGGTCMGGCCVDTFNGGGQFLCEDCLQYAETGAFRGCSEPDFITCRSDQECVPWTKSYNLQNEVTVNRAQCR